MTRYIIALLLTTFGAATANAEKESVDELNELLKGEISAVETYNQALQKVGDVPGADKLRQFREGHQSAIRSLSELVVKQGGTPATGSGAWGVWAKTVTASSKVFGDTAALKALKEGEEHGVKEYQDALEDEDVPALAKDVIRDKLLPAQQKHIEGINQLMTVS